MRERPRVKKLVDGAAAARPGTIVNGNEAASYDRIVKRFKAQFDRLVPVGVDVQEGDLWDVDGRKGVLEKAGNDADAR
jgi:hypothetical protein